MKLIILILLNLFLFNALSAQDTLHLTINEVIRQGVSNSIDATIANNEYKSGYWQYCVYKTDFLPEITLNSTLPFYSKSYNTYQNSDGTYTFVENNYSRLDFGLKAVQNIPWTGGTLVLESSLDRLKQHNSNALNQYMSTPISLTLEQPIFGFNKFKWTRKIEPLKYKVSQQKLAADIEEVASISVRHYFSLLLEKTNLEIEEQNLVNRKKILEIGEERRKLGQISDNDLLQLQSSLLKTEANVLRSQVALRSEMFKLCTFLNYDVNSILVTEIPQDAFEKILFLDYAKVLSLAKENNPFAQDIQRRKLEAQRDVDQAKLDRWNIDLTASFGISGQQSHFKDAYDSNNLKNNQLINLGLKVPLFDWGKGKSKVKIAEANQEIITSRTEKEEQEFNQEIFDLVESFNNQSKQLQLSQEMDKIAQKRYQTAIESFELGKIDLLNLNDAQNTKDEARRNYIQQLHMIWNLFYDIRRYTLYDFILNKGL